MPTCVVLKCDYKKLYKEAKAKGETFQSFPLPKEPPELRELWLKKLNIINFQPTKNTYFCQKHFEDDAFVSKDDNKTTRGNEKIRKKLKPLAYPTLFLKPEKITKARKTKNSSKLEKNENEQKNDKNIDKCHDEDMEIDDEILGHVETIEQDEDVAAVEEVDTVQNKEQDNSIDSNNISVEHDHSYQEKKKVEKAETPKVC